MPAIISAVILLVSTVGCATLERPLYSAPPILPEITREMKSPGFWAGRHPFPNRTLLDNSRIRAFNAHIRNELKLTTDITGIGGAFAGAKLQDRLNETLASFRDKTFYLATSRPVDKSLLTDIEKNMRPGAVPADIKVRYGLTNRYADQRILPTGKRLYEHQGDIYFDELQNSSLDLGTPLAVLHESRDGKWVYVMGPSSDGWVEKDRVSMFGPTEIKKYIRDPEFCVVTGAKADIFLNRELTDYHDTVRMGARFRLGRIRNSAVVEISVPYQKTDGSSSFKKAYVKKESVSFGYPAYTPRNVIDQAFRLINAPYSWGSAHGEQDCSGFIQQVFAVFGISLPRNSSAQAEAGVLLARFGQQTEDREKIKILSEKAVGGTTLIYMNGHIMLFLGIYEGKPYIIHDVWGYRVPGSQGDKGRVIGRVVVTGLDLGKGSVRGPLLRRIISVRDIAAIQD